MYCLENFWGGCAFIFFVCVSYFEFGMSANVNFVILGTLNQLKLGLLSEYVSKFSLILNRVFCSYISLKYLEFLFFDGEIMHASRINL